MSDYTPVRVLAKAPIRGGGSQEQREFPAQSMDSPGWAWGSSPATCMIRYFGDAPVTSGAELQLTIGDRVFSGLCRTDVESLGPDGYTRTLQFVDFREYLSWDQVFGCFNRVEVILTGGQRVKRWKHMYPADYALQKWTTTDAPLKAYQVIDLLLGASTVASPWLTAEPVYHTVQMNYAIRELDCLSGKTLGAALQEVTEQQGLVFCLWGGPYKLVWVMKGEGTLPLRLEDFPDGLARKELGWALSGHPTRIRVVGERNIYQVLNITLEKDWAAGWEVFHTMDDFVSWVYTDVDDANGVAYSAQPDDPDHWIGWMLAAVRAYEMTVRQYIDIIENAVPGNGATFRDNRKYAGKMRMDMPVALYLRVILWRAFRPVFPDGLLTAAGEAIPQTALTLVDRMLARVNIEPLTGVMSADTNQLVEGAGMVIAKAFNIGSEVFNLFDCAALPAAFFATMKLDYGPCSFAIDASGEGDRFIILDDPAVTSTDMWYEDPISHVIALNATFTLTVPSVKAALSFEAERFIYLLGVAGRDGTVTVGGLSSEYVRTQPNGGSVTEIPFADGKLSADKANDIAAPLLLRQWAYAEGGWTSPTPQGTELSGVVDRISVTLDPHSGYREEVRFTNEWEATTFQPERDLDRRTVQNSMFPSQMDIRRLAEEYRLLASGLKANPDFRTRLMDMLNGKLGKADAVISGAWVNQASANAATAIPAGSVVSGPEQIPGTNTAATHPLDRASTDIIFHGVTLREGEVTANRRVAIQTGGTAAVLVQGPVAAGDTVGMAGTGNYLIKAVEGESGWNVLTTVGRALMSIADTSTVLIKVQLGVGGGGSGGEARWA